MATVINTRDVILQDASIRLNTEYIQSNLIVTSGQVEGAGLVVDGARSVSITANSQAINYPSIGSPSPSFITITVIRTNLTEAASLSIVSGTMSLTPALTEDVCVIDITTITSSSLKLRASVTQDSVTYSDDITLVKIEEGSSAYQAFLTNEKQTLITDKLGNVLSFSGALTYMKMYEGNVDRTASCSFSIPSGGNPDSLGCTLTSSGKLYVSTWPDRSDTTATLTVRATYGSHTEDRTFTLVKSEAVYSTREARAFYIGLSGTNSTWDSALATSIVSQSGGPMLLDVVTEFNNSEEYSETRSWDGENWISVNAYVDGNLLVSGTVTANKLTVNTLSSIISDLGTITAGTITLNSTGFIRGGQTAYAMGNGFWLGYNGGVYKSSIGNSSGDMLTWDGTNLEVSGKIMASSGEFRNSDASRVFNLDATSTQPVLKVGDGIEILADGTATFGGTLTASAIDAVDTINIKGSAIFVPVEYTYSDAPITSSDDYLSPVTIFDETITDAPVGGGATVSVIFYADGTSAIDAFGMAKLYINSVEVAKQKFGVRTAGGDSVFVIPVILSGALVGTGSDEIKLLVHSSRYNSDTGTSNGFYVRSTKLTVSASKR